MALGTTRTRNWGKEDQEGALRMALQRKRLAYQVRKGYLYLAPSNGQITLPFNESFACLRNVRRGQWQATSIQDGRLLARGRSERDVVRATIEAVCK